MRRVKSSEYKPAAMPSRHSSAVSLGPGQGNAERPQPGVPRGHPLSPTAPHPTCAAVAQGGLIGALPERRGSLQGALGLVLEDGGGELLQAAAQQVGGFLSPLVPGKLLPPSYRVEKGAQHQPGHPPKQGGVPNQAWVPQSRLGMLRTAGAHGQRVSGSGERRRRVNGFVPLQG